MENKMSIVVPVYMGRNMLKELILRITTEVDRLNIDYEIILVDDCCPEDSWELINNEIARNQNVKAIKLSKNFGQQNAINAGLEYATGNWIVVMDCDLQDRPEEISRLYEKVLTGFDIVFASRVDRKDGFLKRMSSAFFYKIFSFLLGLKFDGTIGNFGIYADKVIRAYNSMPESGKAFSPLIRWMGFTHTKIDVVQGNRAHGESSYTWSKLFQYGTNLVISYSDRPLRMTIFLGFSIVFSAVLFVIYCFWAYYSDKILVPGYASIIASIWFLSGLIIFILGVTGLYISKVFENVKSRASYIVDEKINV